MAEVQPGPAASRGRSTHRGGRGGHSTRGGGRSSSKNTNGEPAQSKQSASLDEQGEIGQLKKKYLNELSTLKELFPDWEDDDLVFGLQENNGDLQDTIERITEGNVSRFAEIKKKPREKSRPKQPETTGPENDTRSGSTRGRGRGGADSARSTRGRASDRGRGGARGGRGGSSTAINGGRSTAQSSNWDSGVTASDDSWNTWGDASASTDTWGGSGDTEVPKSSIIPQGTTKSWASIMAKPKTPPAAPKTTAAATSDAPQQAWGEEPTTDTGEPQGWDQSTTQNETGSGDAQVHDQSQTAHTPTLSNAVPSQPAQGVTPPKDPLTENNLGNLPDASQPSTTETVASTRDPHSAIGSVTPSFAATQQQTHGQPSRPPIGGYATTAWKAAGVPGRSGSFQRRLMAQQEAVVMPGNHAVDRATVQFGSMGLNGDEGANKPLDVDDEREDVETRAQPPQQSPSQPRASLPPGPRQTTVASEPSHAENAPTPKQAPGLPTPLQQQPGLISSSQPQQNQAGAPGLSQHATTGQPYNQYGRYGPGPVGQDSAAPLQKPQDPFSQQLSFPSNQGDLQGAYGGQSQGHQQYGQHSHHLQNAPSQGQQDIPTMQPSNDARNTYQNYYGSSYGGQTSMQENMPPPRSTSGFGTGDQGHGGGQMNQYHSRIAENHASGHNTPNPPLGSQSHHTQQMHHQGHNQGTQGGFPYGNPYYGGSYYGGYMNQFPNQYGYGHQGFGGPFGGGKGGMYSQPHHGYAMSSQTNYDQLHPSSPTNAAGFGGSSMGGRDAGMSGLNEYTRSGSTQPTQATHTNASAGFGGMGDTFGRSGSGLAGHQGYGQQTSGVNEESLKPLHDNKMGPSPSLGGGQQGRPGSAFNAGAPQSGTQSGYGPPQQGFGGGYPSHLTQLQNAPGSHYGGFGGLGGQHASAQGHQGGAYGGYGGFGNNYGNYGGRGWGGNYGH